MKYGISIIVPLYNKAHRIERSLESVFAQNDDRYEVIVVDDGSTDNSAQIVKDNYGSRLTFISQKNGGPSAARNTGAEYATNKFLLFLDADDKLTPDCVGVHLRAFQDYPASSFCITSHQVIDQGQLVDERLVSSPHLIFEGEFGCIEGFHPSLVFGIHLPCVSIEKSLFSLVNGFDTRLRCWEVTDFLFRISILKKTAAYTKKITVLKHEDPVNSQFKRENKNVRYLEIISRTILERINDVPDEYRTQTLKPVKSMLEELFRLREFGIWRELGKLACGHFKTYGIVTRFCLLVRLPVSVLRALLKLKGAL